MKKAFTATLLYLLIYSTATYAQIPVSPMHDMEGKTVHQAKVFSVFEQYNTNNASGNLYSSYGKYNGSTSFDTSGQIITTSAPVVPLSAHLGAASGDFNGDGYDDLVSVVIDANRKPYVTVSMTDTSAMRTASSFSFEINQLASTLTYSQNRVSVVAGNFSGNNVDEFVVAYIDSATYQLHLNRYSVNGGSANLIAGVLVPKDSTGATLALAYKINSFHLAKGDFDNNGDDELAVGYLAPGTSNQNNTTYFYIAAFDFSGAQTVYKGASLIYSSGADNCSIVSGNYSATGKADVAWAIGSDFSSNGFSWVGIAKLDMTQAYSGVVTGLGTPLYIYGVNNGNRLFGACNLSSGDLNGDGTDEIVWVGGSEMKVISVTNPGMTYQNMWTGQTAVVTGFVQYPNSGLAVADVDRDGKAEIFLMSSDSISGTETFYLQMLRVSANLLTSTSPASKSLYNWDNTYYQFPNTYSYPPRRYSFITGDFDGKAFTVGPGTMYFKPNIVQPLVILNTPPVHFDVLNDTSYDVTHCYNGSSCDFNSTYNTSSNTQIDISTSVNQDWGVSAKLSAGGNFGIVDVGGYMSAKYGEKYSNVSGSSSTVNISTQVTATDDDYIYALVNNFYVWEYPVYRKSQFMGNILSVTPVTVGNQWFPSKSWSALRYIPNHEVGCILSYKDYPQLTTNPDLQEKIKASYTGNSFLLNGSNNTFDWSLNYTDVTSNSASTEKDINVEVGGEVGLYGVKLEVSGTYDQSAITSYTSTVTNNLLMQAHLGGGLNASIGEVSYTVTPYTYWASNGALVLDYAATPELPVNNGGTATWWSANYTKQDPAFIMPWRYDPEKGYTLQDPRKRRQTKSIVLYPDSASTGDTVTIRAVIHNFGLVASDNQIKVRFYVGDPYYQNVITDVNGVSDFYLPVIDVRDRQIIEIKWKIPSGLYKFPKIYASIDPDNTLNEIHRNNNIGWNLFTIGDGSNFDPDTIVNSIQPVAPSVNHFEIYPNPATNKILIRTDETMIGNTITVTDITGRLVLKHEILNPKSEINCNNWVSGVYFVNAANTSYKLFVQK